MNTDAATATDFPAAKAAFQFNPDDLDRRRAPRFPLMLSAWIWRPRTSERPIAVRLLDHSATGVGFICPVQLIPGESIELALEGSGPRHVGLRVAHCESMSADTFRIGAHS